MKEIRDRFGRFVKGYKSPRDKRVKRICEICEKEFLVHKYRADGDKKRGRFCSRKCKGENFRGSRMSPATEFKIGRKGIRGKKNIWWKGGISHIKHKIKNRNKRKFYEWGLKVMARDKNKCVNCGTQKDLMAHHIIPVRKNRALWFDINNGKTLCRNCHARLEGGIRY